MDGYTNNVRMFPYTNTPMWKHLEMYHRRQQQSELLADMYLRDHVPDQLHMQIRLTVQRLIKKEF